MHGPPGFRSTRPGTLRRLRRDVAHFRSMYHPDASRPLALLLFAAQPANAALVLMRFAAEGSPIVALIAQWRLRRYGCDVGRGAVLGGRVELVHATGIVIASGVRIGDRCRIFHHVTLGESFGGWPTLEDMVRVLPGAVIVGGIAVGHNASIGANSFVCADVPPFATVPAGTRWTRSTLAEWES